MSPESPPWSVVPAAPTAPPPRRSNRALWIVLTILLALVLTGGIVAVVERLVQTPSAFDHHIYATAVFTISPQPTAQQVRDAAGTLEADVAHLGGSNVQSAIHGSKVEIAVPRDEGDSLVPMATRRLTPRVALVQVDGSGALQQQAKLGEDCYDGGYVFCDPDRENVGVIGYTYFHGQYVADATAAADPQGGTWSVTVSFTNTGKSVYTQAVKDQTGGKLLAYAIQLDEGPWSLTPFTADHALKPDGRIPNLTEVEAKRIAAALRLSRSQVELTGELKA